MGFWNAFRWIMATIRLTRLKFIGAIVFALVVYNEWIIFLIKSYSWPKLDSDTSDKDIVKILIVADPQILSIQSEPNFPFNYVAVWDANRYVSRSFHMSVSHTQPDIIVFLGDIMNDGSISSSDQFDSLSQAFKSLFPIPPEATVFYIPGDNDIGGEGYDKVSPEKIKRFSNAFNVTDSMRFKFLNLYHLNVIPGASNRDSLHVLSSSTASYKAAAGNVNMPILFSHFPLLPSVEKSIIQKINEVNPSLIFSGHDHDSYKFIGKKSKPQADQFWVLRDEGKVWQMDLRGEELHEISVPTCSYRMGKQKYGYGFALINREGILKYTVLWLPSRFTQLWCYFWGLCICVAVLIYPFCIQCHEWFCTKPSSATVRKYHRV